MKKSLGAAAVSLTNPVWIVGTYDAQGRPNVMAAAWAGVCCSDPPCIYVALRKATYTYGNIVQRQAYTVSVPSETYVKQADFFGIASGRDVDKLTVAGLTAEKSDVVDAPYVAEFPLVLECKVLQTVEIGRHTQFIGQIMDAKADEEVLGEEGRLDVAKIKPFLFSSVDRSYSGIGNLLGQGFRLGRDVG